MTARPSIETGPAILQGLAMIRAGTPIARAAAAVGVSRATMQRAVKRAGIEVKQGRPLAQSTGR